MFRHTTTLKGHIAQLPNLVHHHVTAIFYHLSWDLILTCSPSILKLPHSYYCSNRLSSEIVASLKPIKATHVDCNLFLSIYIINILKIILLKLCMSSSPSANLPFLSFMLLQFSSFPLFTSRTCFQNSFLYPFTS